MALKRSHPAILSILYDSQALLLLLVLGLANRHFNKQPMLKLLPYKEQRSSLFSQK